MRKQNKQLISVGVRYAPASAPTLQEVQQGAASGLLARLFVAYYVSQQKTTPEQQKIGVQAVQAS